MRWLKRVGSVLKTAGTEMSNDQATTMAAALAYYTVFSIAPLLIIGIGVAGLFFGAGAGDRVFDAIKDVVGPQGASAIGSMVRASENQPHAGLIATVVGVVTLLVGASGVFQQLVTSLDIIWKVAVHPKATWRVFLRQRLVSFGMIAVIGFLLLVSLVVTAAINSAEKWAGGFVSMPASAVNAINAVISVLIIGALFAAIFKVLPDVRLRWRDVWRAGIMTAILFTVGKSFIGIYIGKAASASSYGAAASLIVVLLWVYYSSLILIFGAELSRASLLRRGYRVQPKPGAVLAVTPFSVASEAIRKVESGKVPAGRH